jgi:hypothetical protein
MVASCYKGMGDIMSPQILAVSLLPSSKQRGCHLCHECHPFWREPSVCLNNSTLGGMSKSDHPAQLASRDPLFSYI